MNFEDSPEEAAYRAKVRAWIAANRPDFSHLAAQENRNWHPAHKEVARLWQGIKADAGYACLSWPKERGGAGGTQIEEAIFNQEEARAGIQFTYFMTGLHMLLPALMEFTTDAASLARVPPAVRGEEIWCQLFSEPSSGSDSAGIRSAAVRDGPSENGDWVILTRPVWRRSKALMCSSAITTRNTRTTITPTIWFETVPMCLTNNPARTRGKTILTPASPMRR